MKVAGVEIFLSPGNRTGLSALDGQPVEDVGSLPDCLVEIHLFRSDDAAAAFVDGLEAAGLGNAMAYDWQPETTDSNRTVLLAKFDEPRADGGLKAVSHRPTGHDNAAHRKSVDRIFAERKVAYAIWAEEADSVKVALDGLKLSGVTHGPGWLRCNVESDFGIGLFWKSKDGPFTVEMGCEELYEGDFDASAAIERVAAESGVGHDHFERHFAVADVKASALVETIRRMGKAIGAATAERKRLMYEDFMGRMRMTGPRRKFLEAGQRSGIMLYVHRANKRARAEGIEIGASEINTLVHAGWIEPADRGYRVTDKGAAALAAPVRGTERARNERAISRG